MLLESGREEKDMLKRLLDTCSRKTSQTFSELLESFVDIDGQLDFAYC